MTDFQVGDRVSVEGVVTQALDTGAYVHLNYPQPINHFFPTECITLVERPRRKLRVGSVWERACTDGKRVCSCGKADRYVWTGVTFVSPNGDNYARETRDIDTWPDVWREVPVEELAREAGA